MRHDRTVDQRYLRRYTRKLERELGLSDETDRTPAWETNPTGPKQSFLLVREHLKELPDSVKARTLGRLILPLGGELDGGLCEDWLSETYVPNRSRIMVVGSHQGQHRTQAPGYSQLLDLAACSVLSMRSDLKVERKIRAFKGADFSDVWYHQVEKAWDGMDPGHYGTGTYRDQEQAKMRARFLVRNIPGRPVTFYEKLGSKSFKELPKHLKATECCVLVDALKKTITN